MLTTTFKTKSCIVTSTQINTLIDDVTKANIFQIVEKNTESIVVKFKNKEFLRGLNKNNNIWIIRYSENFLLI